MASALHHQDINFWRVPELQPVPMAFESPSGRCELTVTRQNHEFPFRVEIAQLFGAKPPVHANRFFPGDVQLRVWLNSLARGLDGDRAPFPTVALNEACFSRTER